MKFLVFTGTVGKTTLRDAVTYTLEKLHIPVQSNTLGYSNELGILLTILRYSDFSLKNPLAWISLFRKEVPHESFVCIELGADFYRDIRWFLKRFTPFTIFISGIADKSWSRDIKTVFTERKNLLEANISSGFIIYNLDDPSTVELVEQSLATAHRTSFSLNNSNATAFLGEWSKNLFTKPIQELFNNTEKIAIWTKSGDRESTIIFRKPLFEPQIYSILATYTFIKKCFPNRITELTRIFENYEFSKERLQIYKSKTGALIIEDSYKAVPFCTYWFADMARNIPAKKKIFVLTEMRPLTFNIRGFYSELVNRIRFADTIYFWGPIRYRKLLKEFGLHTKELNNNNYVDMAKEILKNSAGGDLILLKGSFRYHLGKLCHLLT